MTELTENSTATEGGIDRRSLLTKAAAAGAIAWTAPLIMSSPAFAGNGVCTPSCAPGAFSPILKGVDVCKADFNKIPGFAGSPLATFAGNSNKMAIISIQAPASTTCPCGGGTPVPSQITGLSASDKFWKMGTDVQTQAALATMCAPALPNNFDLNVFPLTGYNIDNVVPANSGFTAGNSFALNKSGAIQNGTFKTNAEICVAVGCPDEVGGDVVFRRCKFSLCFSYTPAGSCSTYATMYFLFTPIANSCVVGCGITC